MTVTATQFQKSLYQRLFDTPVATDITITPITHGDGESSDGGFTPTSPNEGTSFTVRGLPHQYIPVSVLKEVFGDINLGQTAVFLEHQAEVTPQDNIVVLGKTYTVDRVHEYVWGGQVIAKLATLNERATTV